jgi:hypothetical protein
VTAVGGVHLCLPRLEPRLIWHHMRKSGVTHFCATPTVLTMTIWDAEAGTGKLPRPVRIGTGDVPPTPAQLERLAELGMDPGEVVRQWFKDLYQGNELVLDGRVVDLKQITMPVLNIHAEGDVVVPNA